MSAITTWGFGVQGGLVTTYGWGGHSSLPAPIGIPQIPDLDAEELVPQLFTRDESVTPELSLAQELIPEYYDTNAINRVPKVTEVEELKPRLNADDEDLTPSMSVDRIKPRLSEAEHKLEPRIVEQRALKPSVSEAETATDSKSPSANSRDIKPGS